MSHYWKLRAAAVMWLRYDRGCPVVSMERGIVNCVPDVLGVTKQRELIEIEIKRTMSDFRANKKKHGMKAREKALGQCWWIPKYFYFLVLPEMVEKVLAEIPDSDTCVGVMSFPLNFAKSTMDPTRIAVGEKVSHGYNGIPGLVVHRRCQADKRATKLTLKSCISMSKHMAGTFSSLLCTLSNHVDRDMERKERRSK
jgi:hypothetical protein